MCPGLFTDSFSENSTDADGQSEVNQVALNLCEPKSVAAENRNQDCQALELLNRFGHDAVCWQNLSPAVSRWFSAQGDAMVGYVIRGDYMIAAGMPIAAPHRIAGVCGEFCLFARKQGRIACFLCAQGETGESQIGSGYAGVCLGAQPVWNPQNWLARAPGFVGLRRQIRRAQAKGVDIHAVQPEVAAYSPEINDCLRAWLRGRWYGMTFLAEPRVLAQQLPGRVVMAVGMRGGRQVLAYGVASPVPARRGYHIEHIARRRGAPNGTTELLIHQLMLELARRGGVYATLGLVALSRRCPDAWDKNPRWFKAAGDAALRFGQSIYRFSALERFRSGLHPECWEPVYAISGERWFSPLTALAMVRSLFSLPSTEPRVWPAASADK